MRKMVIAVLLSSQFFYNYGMKSGASLSELVEAAQKQQDHPFAQALIVKVERKQEVTAWTFMNRLNKERKKGILEGAEEFVCLENLPCTQANVAIVIGMSDRNEASEVLKKRGVKI